MSAPRPVFPGRFHMITRRCTQRQFLLRPDEETNNAFIYCLAEAAARYEISVVLSQMMSNHHHTVVYDPNGQIVEFMEHFHKMMANCLNALRGRRENLWSNAAPSDVELVELSDVLDKLVYTATNPVKDGLVDRVDHWPGPRMLASLMNGRVLRAYRPRFFFSEFGVMPESIELTLTIPPELGDRDDVLAQIDERVTAFEAACAKDRLARRCQVLGRARILRQSWRACPDSYEPKRTLRPRVAARGKWARIETLRRNRAFVSAYRSARAAWLAGTPVVFPAGTYWLRRFANVSVAPTEAD